MSRPAFNLSTAAQLAKRWDIPVPKSDCKQDYYTKNIEEELISLQINQKPLMNNDEVQASVLELRTLLAKINEMRPVNTNARINKKSKLPIANVVEEQEPEFDMTFAEFPEFEEMFSPRIQDLALHDTDAKLRVKRETNSTLNRIKELLSQPEVFKAYQKYFLALATDYHKLKYLLEAYKKRKLSKFKIDPTDIQPRSSANRMIEVSSVQFDSSQRKIIGLQSIELIDDLLSDIAFEMENLRNRISVEGRSYRKSDNDILHKLYTFKLKLEKERSELMKNAWIARDMRIEEIRHDSKILNGYKDGVEHKGDAVIMTPGRDTLIHGDEESAQNYIASALRSGKHIELTGPTGTGKTHAVAVPVATAFCDGREPCVISGGPGVYRSTFYGSPKGLDSRYEGNLIKCLKEDRVLIIDEDNRVDPRQMAEIKYILGLKRGRYFIHPDTGESILVPPHFAVVVTRNEKGEHHKDRFDLSPEYRREFTFGSFEVGYYTPQEMYDKFMIPKLVNDDCSIALSMEEVGGELDKTVREKEENILDLSDITKADNKWSPVLAVVYAAREIQEHYRQGNIHNLVMESGFLIGVLDGWKDIQHRESSTRAPISFLEYLETRLIAFIKRPAGQAGNEDRLLLIETLYKYGFFRDYAADKSKNLQEKRWNRKAFNTSNDGDIYENDADFNAMKAKYPHSTPLFNPSVRQASKTRLNKEQVAYLDPFKTREIPETTHPLHDKIEIFKTSYEEFLSKYTTPTNSIRPITFDDEAIDNIAKRKTIITGLVMFLQKRQTEKPTRRDYKAVIDQLTKLSSESVLAKFLEGMNLVFTQSFPNATKTEDELDKEVQKSKAVYHAAVDEINVLLQNKNVKGVTIPKIEFDADNFESQRDQICDSFTTSLNVITNSQFQQNIKVALTILTRIKNAKQSLNTFMDKLIRESSSFLSFVIKAINSSL